MTKGDKVVGVARSQVGVVESPPGSNDSPKIREYISSCGIGFPVAWCGCFARWCFKTAGVEHNELVHPSTAQMCANAKAQHAFYVSGTVPAGALIVRCGIHTEIVEEATNGS